jgi:hypothetical protein
MPVDKRAAGYAVLEGASENTNVISHVGHKVAPGMKFGFRALGTKRVFGMLGRANIFVSGAFAAYDVGGIATCIASTDRK